MDDQPTSSAASPKPRRRWYQFSLRTMLIVVTLLAVGCTYYSWQVKIVRERQAWFKIHPVKVEIDISDIPYFKKFSHGNPNQRPSWLRTWMGDSWRKRVYVLPSLSVEDKQAAASLFPEADILEIPRDY